MLRCQQLADRVRAQTVENGAGSGLVGLTLIGRCADEIMAGLSQLAARARRTVWNMQPTVAFDPADPSFELNELSRRRGVDLQFITTQRAVRQSPLLTSCYPFALVGPVHLRTIFIDEDRAVLEGQSMPSGDGTAWLVTRADLVAEVSWIWHETKRLSRAAVPEGSPPPLTKRQFAVACLMATGVKDSSIAHELGVSPRTVATDVERVFQILGATSRLQAGLFMRGRSPNGRRPRPSSPDLSSVPVQNP